MFPPQVKVQIVPFGADDVPEEWRDEYYRETIGYVDMDDLRYGDLNNTINKAKTGGIQTNIYITYDYDKQKKLTTSFHDEDEFRHSDIPDVSLVFEDGRYTGYGLGGGPFAQVIIDAFKPYEDFIKHEVDWDKLLDKAIKDACTEIDILNAADEQ